jgi:hypothetical protein
MFLILNCWACLQHESPVVENLSHNPMVIADKVIEHETIEGPIQAVISLTPPDPRLGDDITMRLLVYCSSNYIVEIPIIKGGFEEFSVELIGGGGGGGAGKSISEHNYILRPLKSGTLTIPTIRIFYREYDSSKNNEMFTDEFNITVHNGLDE